MPTSHHLAFTDADSPHEDPDFVSEDDRFRNFSDAQGDAYIDACSGVKLGGTPRFLQGDEVMDGEGTWRLLAQIPDSDYDVRVPYAINFGSGVAYAFIDAQATRGAFIWQC